MSLKEIKEEEVVFTYEINGFVALMAKGVHYFLKKKVEFVPLEWNTVAREVTSSISNKTHTSVEIKNISISFPKSVVIKEFFLDDLQKDTLLYAGEAKVNIAFKDLLKRKINIKSFSLEGVNLHLLSF